MADRQQLKESCMKAIKALFADDSVSQAETKSDLKEIVEEIEVMSDLKEILEEIEVMIESLDD